MIIEPLYHLSRLIELRVLDKIADKRGEHGVMRLNIHFLAVFEQFNRFIDLVLLDKVDNKAARDVVIDLIVVVQILFQQFNGFVVIFEIGEKFDDAAVVTRKLHFVFFGDRENCFRCVFVEVGDGFAE